MSLARPLVTPLASPLARGLPSDGLVALDFDFTQAGTNSGEILVGGKTVTFSRASTAYRRNSSGLLESVASNIARIDHDKDGNSLGLLIEEARTNLLTRSEEFDHTDWSKVNLDSVSANAATAPDGATAADKVIPNTSVSRHSIGQNGVTVSSSTSYTLSVFAEAAGYDFLVINTVNPSVADNRTYFDLANGTVGTTDADHTARIEDYGNGRYRCSVTITTTGSQTTMNTQFEVNESDGQGTYAGDGSSSIYIWGAQFEAGAFPTSYIKTVSSSATRAAESASIATSAFAFNDGGPGTVVCDCRLGFAASDLPSNTYLWEIHDGTTSNRIRCFLTSSVGELTVIDGGSAVVQLRETTNLRNYSFQQLRAAFAWSENSSQGYYDGNVWDTEDTSATIPSGLSTLRLGNFVNGTGSWSGHIKTLQYYNTRKPNAFLVSETA